MKNLLLLAALLLPAPAAAQARGADTFVHLTGRYWHTLDPHNAFDTVSFIVSGNLYESLITFKSVFALDAFEPFLAEKVPTRENGLLSKDGLQYRFPIRQGVRFHDGSTMTPEDVRYSLLRFMLLDTEGGPAALLLRPLLGVASTRGENGKPAISFKDAAAAVKVDGGAVVIRLKKPDATFLKVVASLPIVVSKKWAAAHGEWDGTEKTWFKFNGRAAEDSYLNEHEDGTGPFKLEALEPDGVHGLALARHDAYWRGPAKLARVVIEVVGNGGLRLMKLETGDADAGYLEHSYRHYAKTIKDLKWFDGLPNFDLGEIAQFNFKVAEADNELLGSGKLDGKGIPADFFADPDVRRGFALAFDYERYGKHALGKKGRRVPGPLPEELVPGQRPPDRYDPAAAEAALRKAKNGAVWENGFVVPVAYSVSGAARQTAAEILREGLSKINPKFKVHLYPLPSKEFYAGLESRKFPLWVVGYYADYPDPQSFAFGLLHSQSYSPRYQGYGNPKIDALLDQAQAAEPARRAALFSQAAALSRDDYSGIYTYAPSPMRFCRREVEGFDSDNNVNNLNFNGFPYFYAYSKTAR